MRTHAHATGLKEIEEQFSLSRKWDGRQEDGVFREGKLEAGANATFRALASDSWAHFLLSITVGSSHRKDSTSSLMFGLNLDSGGFQNWNCAGSRVLPGAWKLASHTALQRSGGENGNIALATLHHPTCFVEEMHRPHLFFCPPWPTQKKEGSDRR